MALLAAGCAGPRWHRGGADAAATDRDAGECRREAQLQAARESWPFPQSAPRFIGGGAQRQPGMVYPYHHETGRFLLENDLTRSCMRGRGYELAPVE